MNKHTYLMAGMLAGYFAFIPAMVVFHLANVNFVQMVVQANEDGILLNVINASWVYAILVFGSIYSVIFYWVDRIHEGE